MSDVSDDSLKAERSRLLAEVNEMAPDPDRQDEIPATMQRVGIIDELLLFRAATAARPVRREALLQAVSEATAMRGGAVEAEAIVRDLAAVAPIESDNGYWWCALCDAGTDNKDADIIHKLHCPHERAREWVAVHPQEEVT